MITGSFSPTLKKRLGLAIVEIDYDEENKELDIDIRQKKVKAKVIRLPFYSKKYKK